MNTKMTPVQKINIQENCGELTFQDQHSCVQALNTIKYKLKFDNFKVIAECKKQ